MTRLKVLSISFSAVFVICALLAFFSGSSILWGLFKAFISACVAVVFLLLAIFFVLKFIPDFFENKSKIDSMDNMLGANLDIRIDDAPSTPSFETSSTENSFENIGASPFENSLKGNVQEYNGAKEDSPENDILSAELKPLNLSNEVQKPIDEEKEEKLKEDDLDVDSPDNEIEKPTSEVSEGVRDDSLSETELSEAIEKDVDRLEELPDLQEFVDSSNLKVEETKGDELMNTGTESFFATDLSENVTDTNIMAKAVRTVLKREV
ncbi:MAG: hypothetical protein ACTTKH_03215 [Treponema sp.]